MYKIKHNKYVLFAIGFLLLPVWFLILYLFANYAGVWLIWLWLLGFCCVMCVIFGRGFVKAFYEKENK